MYPTRKIMKTAVEDLIMSKGYINLKDDLYPYLINRFNMTDEEIAMRDEWDIMFHHEARRCLQDLQDEGRVERGAKTGEWKAIR